MQCVEGERERRQVRRGEEVFQSCTGVVEADCLFRVAPRYC